MNAAGVVEKHALGERPKWCEGMAVVRRTARDRDCESCGRTIPKGAVYVRNALPPDSDLGNRRWMVMATCGWTTTDCHRPRDDSGACKAATQTAQHEGNR